MSDPMDELKAMAATGIARRNQARLTMTVLFLVVLLQIASTVTLGVFVVSWRHQDRVQNAARVVAAAASAKRDADLYAKENDTNNVVRVHAGQPLAAPIVPPVVSTTTTTVPASRRPGSTAPASPPGRSSPTTATTAPPATAAPTPSQPPPPPPPTTTTAPCPVRVLSVCIPP